MVTDDEYADRGLAGRGACRFGEVIMHRCRSTQGPRPRCLRRDETRCQSNPIVESTLTGGRPHALALPHPVRSLEGASFVVYGGEEFESCGGPAILVTKAQGSTWSDGRETLRAPQSRRVSGVCDRLSVYRLC